MQIYSALNCCYHEEEGHHGEGSQEIEFALDEGYHCWATVLIQTAIEITLCCNLNFNVRLPDRYD